MFHSFLWRSNEIENTFWCLAAVSFWRIIPTITNYFYSCFFSARESIGIQDLQIYFCGHFYIPGHQFDHIFSRSSQIFRFPIFLLICEVVHNAHQVRATSLLEFPKEKHVWMEHWKYFVRLYWRFPQHWTNVCHFI